jgi:hypothetical protein
VTDDEKIAISIGNRNLLRFTIGGVVIAIFGAGMIWSQLQSGLKQLDNVATKQDLQVIHAEQRENRAATMRLAAKEDSTKQELIIVKERTRVIESGQNRIERKIEKLDDDRIRYKWDRSSLLAPVKKTPPPLVSIRDMLIRREEHRD